MRFLVAFLALALPTFAANHYIRTGAGGTGDGSNWTNAFASFAAARSATYVRGDTYYIAGGTYSESPIIDKAVSGTLWIYFKKATVADHGTATGWDDAYGTAVAVITSAPAANGESLDIDKGYISFDGVTGSGTSGHGIKISNTSAEDQVKTVHIEPFMTGPIIFKHCEVVGPWFADPGTGAASQGIYWTNFNALKGSIISDNWIHNVTINGGIFMTMVGTSYSDYGLLFENNVVSETGGCTDADKHGQGLQLGQQSEMGYIIIRNNIFRNIVGSGMIAGLTSGDDANHHDWLIYNNRFYITDTATYTIVSPGVVWHEPQGTHSGAVMNNIQILNNVMYGITGATNLGQIVLQTEGITATGNVAENNVWEGCGFTAVSLGLNTEDHNGYYGNTGTTPGGTNKITGLSSAFTNAATYDFTLKVGSYALAAGLNLTSIFTTYADGSARANSAFDLGPLPASGLTAGGSTAIGRVVFAGSGSIN